MSVLYHDRLNAIHTMLNDSSPEIIREGYDLLFVLWKENIDSSDFFQDLMPIAVEQEAFVQELRECLDRFSTKYLITDTFLRGNLEVLASKVEEYKLAKQKEDKQIDEKNIPEKQVINFARWQKVLVVAILVIVVFVITINLIYVVPTKGSTFSTDLIGLNISYKSPAYLSVHDENTVEISVENTLQTELEGTLMLVFDDPEYSIKPAKEKKFSTEIEIRPRDKESQEFSFQLTKKPIDKNLKYHFLFVSSNGSQYRTETESFSIAPIPYLRSASNWLFGSLGGIIIASLWEQIKKIGEGVTQKLVEQLKSAFSLAQD